MKPINVMQNLVLQSFGQEKEYKRAIITILSYYAYTSLPYTNTQVLLFTDTPEYFKLYLNGLPIQYILLTPAKIKQMRGNIDFLHRMKIAMIDEAFQLTKGDILYADSDTFFVDDPTPLMKELNADKSFMHVLEYEFENLRTMPLPGGATFRAFLNLLENKNISLSDGNSLEISPKHTSWNAGVMFLHESHFKFIPDVYALTEQFYPPTQNHASEQYAFSIVLQNNTQLQPCEKVIYHYWYRVKKQIIDLFLSKNLTVEWAERSLEEKLKQVKQWTVIFPDHFKNHELMLKDNAVQAFNENKFKEGYSWTFKVFYHNLFPGKKFIKDVLYHTKRKITGA